MKIIKAMLIAATMVLSAVSLSAREDGYEVDSYDGRIYFDDRIVYDADPRTFRDLGYGYAKDRNHVYYMGEILEYVDPSSFKVSRRFAVRPDYGRPVHPIHPTRPVRPSLPDRPTIDISISSGHGHRPPVMMGHHYYDYSVYAGVVYYGRERVSNANAHSFQSLSCGYGMDAFRVYWAGREVKGAYVSSFTVLSFGYAKDAFNVYWHGKKVEGAFPATFKVHANGYAEDAFNAYYNGKDMDDDDDDDDDDE